MKIALVVDLYEDAGNGTSISARRFAQRLTELGHQVVVLCYSPDASTDIKFCFPVFKMPFFQKHCEKQNAILAKPIDEEIRKAFEGVDLVHIYLPFLLGTHCARIAEEMRIPVLGCFHLPAEHMTYNIGLKHVPFAASFAYRVMKRYHYRYKWIKDIHCPSNYMAERISKYNYKQDLHVISNGYCPDFFPAPEKKPDELRDKFVIASVGRFTSEKCQQLIIKAVAKLKYREKIQVILAGRGPKSEYYANLSRRLGVNCSLSFLDQAHLIPMLNYADLYIQASTVEAESISCLEAIACGKVPVISDSKRSATKQFALDERSLFRCNKVDDLVLKIDYWYENSEERQAVGEKYAEFAKQFSLEKSMESILQVYQYVIDKFNGVTNFEDRQMIKDYNMGRVTYRPRKTTRTKLQSKPAE